MPAKYPKTMGTLKGAGEGAAAGALIGGVPGAVIGGIYGGVQGFLGGSAEEDAANANAELSAAKAEDIKNEAARKEQLRQEAISGADTAAQRSEQNYQDLIKAQQGVEKAYGTAAQAAERGGQVASTSARIQAAEALRAAAGKGQNAAALRTTGETLGQQVGQVTSDAARAKAAVELQGRSEEHTSELQSH